MEGEMNGAIWRGAQQEPPYFSEGFKFEVA